MKGFNRGCGLALLLGGALTILINVIISPLLFADHTSSVRMTTRLFLLRQSASGLTALLLLFGCTGLHLVQRNASGKFGAAAFGVLFVGCALLFSVEFADVFVLRAVAQTNLDTLAAIDKNSLMNIGFASTAGLFAAGWLLLSISIWRTGVLPRWAAVTTSVGLLSIPLLQASPLHLSGAIAGNVVFGVGLIGLGHALAKIEMFRG
jgi:hypothetical protein